MLEVVDVDVSSLPGFGWGATVRMGLSIVRVVGRSGMPAWSGGMVIRAAGVVEVAQGRLVLVVVSAIPARRAGGKRLPGGSPFPSGEGGKGGRGEILLGRNIGG